VLRRAGAGLHGSGSTSMLTSVLRSSSDPSSNSLCCSVMFSISDSLSLPEGCSGSSETEINVELEKYVIASVKVTIINTFSLLPVFLMVFFNLAPAKGLLSCYLLVGPP
jgi:hypothetical protein